MNVRTIEESGMHFLCPEDETFEMERYTKTTGMQNVRSVEFLRKWCGGVLFIEAKTSMPRADGEHFQEYIANIAEKFIHSLGIYLTILFGRRMPTAELDVPNSLRDIDLSQAQCILVVVVKDAKADWLPPLAEGLKDSLRTLFKIACLQISPYILNEDMARRKKLIA